MAEPADVLERVPGAEDIVIGETRFTFTERDVLRTFESHRDTLHRLAAEQKDFLRLRLQDVHDDTGRSLQVHVTTIADAGEAQDSNLFGQASMWLFGFLAEVDLLELIPSDVVLRTYVMEGVPGKVEEPHWTEWQPVPNELVYSAGSLYRVLAGL